jgi:hypothetical protein
MFAIYRVRVYILTIIKSKGEPLTNWQRRSQEVGKSEINGSATVKKLKYTMEVDTMGK